MVVSVRCCALIWFFSLVLDLVSICFIIMAEEALHAKLKALEEENAALLAKGQVNHVSVKLPPFWPNRVGAWFAIAEAQFKVAGITSDATMYSHALSQLDVTMAGEIEDLLINPPKEGKYLKLKEALMQRLSQTEEQRVRQLVSDEELGDLKPSQFLRRLKSLAGKSLSDTNIIRQLWLRRLPQQVQAILAAQADLDLDKVADLADRIVEVSGPASVYATAAPAPSQIDQMMARIEELSRQMTALTSHQRERSRSRSHSRSSRSSSPQPKHCWYHKKFAARASKCIQPCQWRSENSSSNQ